MFGSTKIAHLAQILATLLVGQVASNELAPPDPGRFESYGHLLIQLVVAIVTIWATVRKALQKSEVVVRFPDPGPAKMPTPGAADAGGGGAS